MSETSEKNPQLTHQGLPPEDCLRLDSMQLKDRDEVIQELRIKHAHDIRALKQLDVYDPNSTYRQKVSECYEAGKKGNETKFKELEEWFKANGYEGI